VSVIDAQRKDGHMTDDPRSPAIVIQFTWTRDQAKTVLAALGMLRMLASSALATRTGIDLVRQAIVHGEEQHGRSPEGALHVFTEVARSFREEPHRGALLTSVITHIEAWLLEHDQGVRDAVGP
jgi:hypothetical protein